MHKAFGRPVITPAQSQGEASRKDIPSDLWDLTLHRYYTPGTFLCPLKCNLCSKITIWGCCWCKHVLKALLYSYFVTLIYKSLQWNIRELFSCETSRGDIFLILGQHFPAFCKHSLTWCLLIGFLMQKILGSHWKSSPKDWLLSLCLRPAADHGTYVAWQTQLISGHAARTETLSHAPVKAWPTNTPGGILICYNLLVLVSKSFKRGGGGWRMERAKGEFCWSSPKGTLPWPEGTNGMGCPCLPWGVPNPACGPGPHFSPADPHPQADIPAWPQPCPQGGSWCPGLGVPSATPQLPWSLLRRWDGLQLARPCPAAPLEPWHHLYLRSSWADLSDCITFFFSDLKTQLHAWTMMNCAILFPEGEP